jgi:hypothetical protein
MEHAIGDRIVNSNNLKMASVVDVDIQEDKIKIQYGDGLTEWVENNKVTNLLIDENDFQEKSFIQD